jgi:hypothetical protein
VLLAIKNASVRATQKETDKRDAAPTMQDMIGATCQLPGKCPWKGVAMRREFVVDD